MIKTQDNRADTETDSGPFLRAARTYYRAGLRNVLPLPPGRKESPPSGYTGADAKDVTPADVKRWESAKGDGNIALRLARGFVGLDVDAYGKRHGFDVLQDAEEELGPLPDTYVSSARDDGRSGIRLYRVPEGVTITKDAEHRLIEDFGRDVEIDGRVHRVSNIEVIRPDHRYMVVWPSTNPHADGAQYRWTDPAGRELDGDVPDIGRVPFLPPAWVEFLAGPAVPKPDRTVPDLDDEDDEDDDLEAAGAGEREYSHEDFEGYLRRGLDELRTASSGTINRTLNDTAIWLFRFTPEFMPEKELAKKLLAAQRAAWVAGGGEDDGDYTAARKTIRSALSAARRSWSAVPLEGADDGPDPMEAILDSAPRGGGGERADQDDDESVSFAEDEKISTKKAGLFFTDARFSEAVAELLRASGFRFVPELGWMSWDGARWRRMPKEDASHEDAVRRWVIKRYRKARKKLDEAEESGDVPPEEIRRLEALVEAWHSETARARRVSAVADARPQVMMQAEQFDTQPDLLNTPSGVVDLRTGELRPHDPELFMTKITRAPFYGPDYTHDTWDRTVTGVPDDSREWIQTFIGQGATGHRNTEGRLLLLDGGGENGKGALVNDGCVWTLGDYAVVASENLLLANSSQHPTEKMVLWGARLTLIDETPEARRLDTQRLKKLLDQPVLAGARYLYKEEVRLVLQHTMIVMTNHLPSVTEFDHGTWRRLTRLFMPYKFVKRSKWDPENHAEHERLGDPTLKVGLTEDQDVQAAVLAWIVRGAMKWYAAGRVQDEETTRIKTDTTAWRRQGDLLMAYVEEFLEFGPTSGRSGPWVLSAELFEHFTEWCESNGHKPWSAQTFRSRWEGHDTVKERTTVARVRPSSLEEAPSRPPSRYGRDSSLPGMASVVRGIRYVTEDVDADFVSLDDDD